MTPKQLGVNKKEMPMVINKNLAMSSFLCLTLASITSQPCIAKEDIFGRSFYLGGLAGYGSTTWEGLVPTNNNQNLALNMSTPIDVEEGGGLWGLYAGYEFTRFFAVEATYLNYPAAKIRFDTISLFSFDHNDQTQFSTKTETVNLMAKIMLVIPNTQFRVFSSAGVADVHREDLLTNQWHIGPTFGVGLNFHFNDRVMGELAGNYTAGFGESQLNPADSFVPFLYTVNLRLAYLI